MKNSNTCRKPSRGSFRALTDACYVYGVQPKGRSLNETEYDLAKLAEDLARAIPEVSELYLFGSRARGTGSARSDVDVLVVASNYIKHQKLRNFSFENCKALDLFLVDNGKATSSQNESFIQADTFQDLLANLGAIKIWSLDSGRAQAKIEWRFKIREETMFVPTALPSAPQNTPQSILYPSKLTLRQLIGNLTIPQIWCVVVSIVGALGAVFWVGYEIGVRFPPPPT